MDQNSDYLTLWTHYEGCGSDDKNRMISTASVLIGFAGALLGASISSTQPWVGRLLAMLSIIVALMSWVLTEVFKIYAGRNFRIADTIRPKLNDDLKAILDIQPAQPKLIFGFANKLAEPPHISATGRIFTFFVTISLFVALLSAIVLLIKFRLN